MAPASQPAALAPETLRRLMAEHNVSNRQLARMTKETDPNGKGLAAGTIGNIRNDADRAGPDALALIARALDEQPDVFIEWRLASARRLLDEREVGLEAALANLARIERALGLNRSRAK